MLEFGTIEAENKLDSLMNEDVEVLYTKEKEVHVDGSGVFDLVYNFSCFLIESCVCIEVNHSINSYIVTLFCDEFSNYGDNCIVCDSFNEAKAHAYRMRKIMSDNYKQYQDKVNAI